MDSKAALQMRTTVRGAEDVASCHPIHGRRDFIRKLSAMGLATAGFGFTNPTNLQAAVATKATNSRAARNEATRAIPYGQLTASAQQRISKVVNKPSMYRRMPINVIDCDQQLFLFLIRHPEVVVNIWQLMGITQVTAQRTGQFTLNTSDGMGTTSSVELVFGNNDTHLMFCEGMYEGPMFRKPLRGRCVLLLKSGHVQTADSRSHITNRLDIFLQVDHLGLDMLTKTFNPIIGKSADVNFVESMKFLERVSRTAETNGTGMQRLAGRLESVQTPVREQFSQLSMNVYSIGQQRVATRGSRNG